MSVQRLDSLSADHEASLEAMREELRAAQHSASRGHESMAVKIASLSSAVESLEAEKGRLAAEASSAASDAAALQEVCSKPWCGVM